MVGQDKIEGEFKMEIIPETSPIEIMATLRERVSALEAVLISVRSELEDKGKEGIHVLSRPERRILNQINSVLPRQERRVESSPAQSANAGTPECHGRPCIVVSSGKARNSQGFLVWRVTYQCTACHNERTTDEVID